MVEDLPPVISVDAGSWYICPNARDFHMCVIGIRIVDESSSKVN